MQKNGIGEVSGVVGGGHLHLLLLERNQDHDVAQEIVLLLVQPRSQHMRIIFTHVVMVLFGFFLLLQPHSSALPFQFSIEIFNFLIGRLELVYLLLQDSLHPAKGRPIYFHLKVKSNCERTPAREALESPQIPRLCFSALDPRYPVLTLDFGSAELTKPLPDCGTQAFWCILWSVQLLHGLQQKLQLVRRWGAACLRLFGDAGAALCLYLCLKSPETFKIISNKVNRILVNAKTIQTNKQKIGFNKTASATQTWAFV